MVPFGFSSIKNIGFGVYDGTTLVDLLLCKILGCYYITIIVMYFKGEDNSRSIFYL